jgi:hypothetical protein
MSPLENRAWLALWTICPPYLVYFALQIALPGWVASLTILERLACLAAASLTHAAAYVTGLLLLKRRERGEGPLADERDHAIDNHATRGAYYTLLAGMIVVGMIMPFTEPRWKVVNTALLVIVLGEALRNTMIVMGYRGAPRLA